MSWISEAIDAAGSVFGWGDASGDILDFGGDIMDIIGSSGFLSGMGQIGQGLLQQRPYELQNEYQMAALDWAKQKWPEQMALQREQIAAGLAAAQAAAGATVKAAGIAAGSADRRAKLAGIMDASGRRIDANNFGTTAKLSAIQEMIRSAGRKY